MLLLMLQCQPQSLWAILYWPMMKHLQHTHGDSQSKKNFKELHCDTRLRILLSGVCSFYSLHRRVGVISRAPDDITSYAPILHTSRRLVISLPPAHTCAPHHADSLSNCLRASTVATLHCWKFELPLHTARLVRMKTTLSHHQNKHTL
uniref:Secreted protein n=1 Tax=Echinococcus granulosus TaxID=6210 RepID=U6FTC6_ECHGR|nr:hypothetical protein EgrG_000161700 [Echinococcus granulosus]